MALLQHPLTYHSDSARIFACIADQPWAMFLDSGQLINEATDQPGSLYGRYDILVAQPFMTFTTHRERTTQWIREQTRVIEGNPFELINQALKPFRMQKTAWPFAGGALGYFGYDLARNLEKIHSIAAEDELIPQMQVGLYDWAVVVDHHHKTAQLLSHGVDAHTRAHWREICALFDVEAKQTEKFEVRSAVQSNMDKVAYQKAFDQVKAYIYEGDCYQVNLAQRFSARATGDAWQAYQKLRELSPAPFMAYMNLGNVKVISGSPERFLQVKDGHVETRPIKGTRPRSDNQELDNQHAEDLVSSVKDRAENLMIVDLLRNDIGKNCIVGTVKADQLFLLQSFANVHHLVSIVTGQLDKNKTAIDLLQGCFPGGSITGAPKLRAMQIIESLELHRRAVYCGAIGYIGFDGNMDTNIAIRTAVYAQRPGEPEGEISFYAGGGIVADSDMEKEYAETFDKASSMMKMLAHFSQSPD
ncbi:MAG: aminodeoxychorismate synthase component I [Betaproteobacteria bacterium]|nr:aminodeoxychorismate synthase component I [Betaproteobacteria bacterium]